MRSILCALVVLTFFSVAVLGSSHSEAPGTAAAPFQDLADLYAFRSYESGREDRLILMITAYGGQKPGLGPNYFTLSDSHMFEMHVSCNNDGTSDTDHLFQFYFGNTMGGPTGTQVGSFDETNQCSYDDLFNLVGNQGITLPVGPDGNGITRNMPVPLKVLEPLSATHPAGVNNLQNWFEHYFVQYTNKAGQTTPLTGPNSNSDGSFDKPFDYVGQKVFGTPADYENYAMQYLHTITNMPSCPAGVRVFAGARADPFGIDLGRTFDVFNYIPIPNFPDAVKDCPEHNFQSNSNIAAIVLEVPISCLPCPRTSGEANIIATWSRVGTLEHDLITGDHLFGTQTNRLGMPLVNEVVVGLKDKKYFSTDVPNNDAVNFLDYVLYPTFPEILNIYFKDIVNNQLNVNFPTIAPTNFPRADLGAIFLTGLSGLNRPNNVGASEMLRLNLDIAPKSRSEQNHYGALAGDLAGFPNGRRVGDDALDITVQVAMGSVCHSTIPIINGVYCNVSDAPVGFVLFRDGAPVDATLFPDTFPFLNTPRSGGILNLEHPTKCNADLPCNGCTPCNSGTTMLPSLLTFLGFFLLGALLF